MVRGIADILPFLTGEVGVGSENEKYPSEEDDVAKKLRLHLAKGLFPCSKDSALWVMLIRMIISPHTEH